MLRRRKDKLYKETNDEEGDGERKFDLADPLKSARFEPAKDKYLLELSGEDMNLKRVQRAGFERPILVERPDGLGLRVPPKSFAVRDVRDLVGSNRVIDVMDVRTQKNIEMSMKDWCKYYECRHRDRLLNVISLEFSHTGLDELVEAPQIVKLLDWVDQVWPKSLKESQTEGTNSLDKMKYPKVQKYCLMSVKGSYTDFHVDFGGTSVWYHILKGKKVFWMVPPTELNLQVFEDWTLSGNQQHVFFGDTVEDCFRVELKAGDTFFIPSGWIHAVYTLEDSLVFGGNFLHSYSIENQLRVTKIEDATKVPAKFRYPFYTELLWYVVQHYVYCLTGKDHLHKIEPAVTPTKEVKVLNSNEKIKNTTGIEDESTESEYEHSDIQPPKKKQQSLKTSTKRRRGRPSKKIVKKKRVEPLTDDESTDIDSANEDHEQPKKPPTTTCRMTKNSLTRLQYEVEDKKVGEVDDSRGKLIKTSKEDEVPTNKKVAPESDKSDTREQDQQPAKMNLAAMMMSEESKLNGWSRGLGGHSIWSDPTKDRTKTDRVHLTRFELTGLKALIKHLSKLSGVKKNLPNLIRNSRVLLDDCRKLLAEHEKDDPELAATGVAITPELLKSKESDMNELIGQFFKQTESNPDDNNSNSKAMKSSKGSPSKLNIDSQPVPSSPSLKPKAGPTSLDASTKASDNRPATEESPPSKALKAKEIKSLSPSKSKAPVSSPAPVRPQSPPTRPLSNNQYKSKNDKDILLPGSFADLIAATSTEKKIFDICGADVTSSLYKVQNLKQAASNTKSSGGFNELIKTSSRASTSSSSPTKAEELLDRIPELPKSRPARASPDIKKETQITPAQKRLINPTFKPQNKERLIYASAPYVRPLNTPSHTPPVSNPSPFQPPISNTAPISPVAQVGSSMQPGARLVWTQPHTTQTIASASFAPTTVVSMLPVMTTASVISTSNPTTKPTNTTASPTPTPVSTAIRVNASTPTIALRPIPATVSVSRSSLNLTSTTTPTVRTVPTTTTPVVCTVTPTRASTSLSPSTTAFGIRPITQTMTLATKSAPLATVNAVRTAAPTIALARYPMQTAAIPLSCPTVPLVTSLGHPIGATSAPNAHTKTPQVDNAALLSLATTALSIAPTMISSTAPSHLNALNAHHVALTTARTPQTLISNPAAAAATMANQSAAAAGLLAGQQLFNPFLPRLPMAHFALARPGAYMPAVTMAAPTALPAHRHTGQLVFARLPTQAPLQAQLQTPQQQQQQPRFLITPPGYVLAQLRLLAPNLVATQGQPAAGATTPTLALAAFKPPASEAQILPKATVKTKK